jgi:hypothetical protein
MSDEPRKPRKEADAALEREIRDGRKFTLAEAIGRLAGPGMMKGVSPATGLQQAAAQIETCLERHLPDSSGALTAVLLRQVRESDLLLCNLDQPLVVLAGFVQRVMGSDFLLHELVRESDVDWGRNFGERPYFQKEGSPPHSDDPYTIESVRSSLSALLGALSNAPRDPGTV